MDTNFTDNTKYLNQIDLYNLTTILYPNDTTNYAFTCPKHNFPIVILLTQIVYAFVCVLGLLGNTLVIYVVLRFSKMQTVTNMYIVNLAIADECFLIGIPFLITTMSLQRWIFGEIMCKVYMITTSINQFTSSMFLFIMSADRYIAVCHPISSPKLRTPFISRIVAVAAWTMSALFMVPISIYSKTITENETTTCIIVWPSDMGNPQKTFTLYSFILGFAMPLTMILIFYCLVIQKLQTVGPKNKSKEKKRSHRKVTKLVLTVITVYAFCWFPYWIAQMALMFGPEAEECQSRMTVFFFLLTGCLSYSNSAMNPVLYAFLSDNFKKSFLKACTCAAGKDVNATLHMENSVFPRRHKANSDRLKPASGSQACLNRGGGTTGNSGNAGTSNEDDEGEQGPLVSKGDHSTSAMTLTSRSNITISTDTSKDGTSKDCTSISKNGVLLTLHPTQV